MWVAGCASTVMHVVIAIERFYTTRPGNLKIRKVSRRKLKVVIACCWLFAVLSELPPMYVTTYDKARDHDFSCYENRQTYGKAYTTFTLFVDLLIPLILMVVLYTRTLMAL